MQFVVGTLKRVTGRYFRLVCSIKTRRTHYAEIARLECGHEIPCALFVRLGDALPCERCP